MSSSKKEQPNISSVNNLPVNSVIQSPSDIIISDAANKNVDDEHGSPSICRYSVCQEKDDDEHNDAVQFLQDCQLPLCAPLHQKAKNHSLVPVVEQDVPKHQQHGSVEKAQEESLQMTNNGQSLVNALKRHICCVCHNQLSKRAKTTNANLLFCSEQCSQQYYNTNRKVDLSLIAEEVIDHVMMPLMDAKVLHYLKCADSKWRTKIEEYVKQSVPVFKFRAKFGSEGSGNGQFNGPYFVVTDKQGKIYVSDFTNVRIQKFDCNGEWKKSIVSNGSGNCEFDVPRGIAFNSKSHMIVVDKNNIVVIDQKMKFVKVFDSHRNCLLQNPHGIAVDADDNIAVADSSNHILQIFRKDGNWKQTIGKKGSADGEFNYPWDVAVCKTSGRIFVSDCYNHRVQVFSSDGKFLFKFGSWGSENGQFQNPYGLVMSNCGQYLFVCDYNNHRIQQFNALNGAFVKSYGSKGSGDGEFNYPIGICISPFGQIIVSENGNNRVQIFE
jgi:DNA-binding beta-propeller fold protein YncE